MKNTIQIFLASRFEEFKDLRLNIKHEIEKQSKLFPYHLILIDLNDNKAESQSALDRSLHNLRESDICLFLIGDTYGENLAEYGKSYTHLEYMEAKKYDKRKLVYCVGELYQNKTINLEHNNQSLKEWQNEILLDLVPSFWSKQDNFEELVDSIIGSLSTAITDFIKTTLFPEEKFVATNKPRSLSLVSKFPRNKEIEAVNSFIFNNHTQSSFTYITGKAGMGKTHFLIDYFSSLSSSNKFLYFINGNDDDDKSINNIYLYLKKQFQLCMRDFPTYIDSVNKIDNELSITEKIAKLFEIYNQYFQNTDQVFLLILDGADLLQNEENILKKLIQSTQGIHYIISGRENNLEKYLKRLHINNDHFSYKEIELHNLNSEHISKILTNDLNCYKKLANKERSHILQLFVKKSEGLPLYLKYQIDTINKKIIGEDNLFNRVIQFLEKLPNKIGDFYIQIFEDLGKDSMELLQILYWYYEPINISFIKKILDFSDETREKVLDEISYLLTNDKIQETIVLCHLSVKEALFEFYKYDGNLQTAIRFNADFVLKCVSNENHLLNYVAERSNVIHNFSKTVYLTKENKLYAKLEDIVYFSLSQTAINSAFINIFYEYLTINTLYNHIKIDKIFNSDATLHSIIKEEAVKDTNLIRIGNKFLSHMAKYREEDIFQIIRLLKISLILENNHFITKYTKNLLKYNYSKVIIEAHSIDILTTNLYNQLNSILLKSFITRIRELDQKPTTMKLYNDSNIVLYVDSKKEKDSLETALIKMVQRGINKKRRSFEQFQQAYSVIKHTNSNKLLQTFLFDMTAQVIANRKNNKTSSDSQKLYLLNKQVEYDFLLKNLNKFQKEDNKYKYLPLEYKNKINRLLQLQTTYRAHGIDSILKTKYQDLVIDMVPIINEKDSLAFHAFWHDKLDKVESHNLINQLLLVVGEETILREFERKILEMNFHEDKILISSLLKIYYKLKEPRKIEHLKKPIINMEYAKKEISLLVHLTGNIEKGSYQEIQQFVPFNINAVDRKLITNDALTLTEIENKFEKIIASQNYEYLSLLLKTFFDNTKESFANQTKVFMKYKDHLDRDTLKSIILNFAMMKDFSTFIEAAEKIPPKEQVNYLIDNLEKLIKKREVQAINDERFWTYTLDLFIPNTEYISELELLIQKIYVKKEFINFAKNHKEYIEEKMTLFADSDHKIIWYFTIVNLVINDETNYKKIFELNGMNENVIDEAMIMLFVFNITKKETIDEFLALMPNDNLLSIGKVKLYAGFKFNDDELLKEGLNIAFELNRLNLPLHLNLNNTIMYTLPNVIKNEFTSELINIFTIPDYQTSTKLKVLFDIFTYNNIDDLNDMESKSIFRFFNSIKSYSQLIKSFLKPEKIVIEEFKNKNIDEIIGSLLSLLEIYKQAEEEEDHELYTHCEQLFNEVKKILDEESIVELSCDIEKVALDNLFDKYTFKDNDQLHCTLTVKLLHENYAKFYGLLHNMYIAYREAEEIGDEESYEKIQDEFEVLKNEILQNQENFEYLKEHSNISSKLQIKLSNIDKFSPK